MVEIDLSIERHPRRLGQGVRAGDDEEDPEGRQEGAGMRRGAGEQLDERSLERLLTSTDERPTQVQRRGSVPDP